MRIYAGGCHCGQVRFEVTTDLARVTACNCSICTRRGYLHLIGTMTAKHHFCRHCGVASFYVPRSHPDKIDVNARCLDGVDLTSLSVARFDGRNWEASIDGLEV